MPLTAIHQPTGARLFSVTQEGHILSLRDMAAEAEIESPFVCPFCDVELRFRRGHQRMGIIVTPHFAHVTPCTTTYQAHPETPEHIEAKAKLATALPAHFTELQDAECIVEYRLPQINRIADVAFVFPDGDIAVHEAQLSPISLGELQKRTADYHAIGIQVTWWLGPKTLQHANWCKEALGMVGSIIINRDEGIERVTRKAA